MREPHESCARAARELRERAARELRETAARDSRARQPRESHDVLLMLPLLSDGCCADDP